MPDLTTLRDKLATHLASEFVSVYDCTRVWEAWSVGTMTQRDFSPLDDRLDEIVDGVMKVISENSEIADRSEGYQIFDATGRSVDFQPYDIEEGDRSAGFTSRPLHARPVSAATELSALQEDIDAAVRLGIRGAPMVGGWENTISDITDAVMAAITRPIP